MTTSAAEPRRSSPAPSMSASICALFGMLARGADRRSSIELHAPVGNVINMPTALSIPAAEIDPTFIPAGLLRALETCRSLPWLVSVATRDRGRAGLASLSVLAVEFSFVKQFRNPRDPARPHGKKHIWPEELISAAVARAVAFLPPTITIDGRETVNVLWAIEEPINVSRPHGEAVALDTLRRVAAAVDAAPPRENASLGDLRVVVPGTGLRHGRPEAGEVAEVMSCDPSRVYSLRAIEAALTNASLEPATVSAATARENAIPPQAAPRRRTQEKS